MAQINPYLTFNGNCEEAFGFYKSAFGTEIAFMGRFKDMPQCDNIPDSEKEKIMHVSLPISQETVLMGSDASEAFGHKPVVGNNMAISVSASGTEEALRIFNALAQGGTVTMPIDKTFWSDLFGMLTDKFGINWMVSFEGERGK